jgi:hypothetical protein
MKKRLLTVFILFQSISIFAQNYYEFTTEAMQLYHNKEYGKSLEQWNQAFALQKGFSNDYYNAACTASLSHNKEKTFHYLRKAIRSGWTDVAWLEKDTDFSSLHESEDWKSFLNSIPKLQEKRANQLHLKLKEKLETLRMEDQFLRTILPDVEKKVGRDSKEYKWFREQLMRRNDDHVLEKIIKIIERHGWVGIHEVGEDANQTLWLVIQHAPLEVQEKYLPMLKESVKKGESEGWYLAFLEDRILMRKKKKQKYGTQALWNNELKKSVIYRVEDPENINSLRRSVGLERIEDYAKNSGFVYNQ